MTQNRSDGGLMKIIGITGGIGSGKSRILNVLKEDYQAYIVEADKTAHTLLAAGLPAYEKIVGYFGEKILDEDGEIDRKKLADIVFHDKNSLKYLDSITHPAVKQEILRLIEEKRSEGKTAYFVIEAALLLQDGYRSICDEIWFVQVDPKIRMERLQKQRNYTEEKCRSVFASQPDDSYYRNGSDRVLDNNGSFSDVIEQIRLFLNYEQDVKKG